jgi:uncharacterized OsmC-like protein
MVVLGLILILLGALAIVSAVFALDVDANQVSYLGLDISPLALFLIGVASAVAIVWGLWSIKFGGQRGLARRREQKRLTELSEKLDEVEADRRRDDEDDRGR